MNVLAVIPAKRNSTRCPHKNYLPFLGSTLTDRARLCALDAILVTEVVVSDECFRGEDLPDIADVAKHALNKHSRTNFDYVVTLQPTCPARTPVMVDMLLAYVAENELGGGVTVCPAVPWVWNASGITNGGPNGYKPSQDLGEQWGEVNAIQVARADAVRAGKRWDWPMALMVLPSYAAIDIDYPNEFRQAERMLPPILDALQYEQFAFVEFTG